eukprot:m51a1_g8527 putative serine-threonine protein (869) ;mRNA; r:124056-127457
MHTPYRASRGLCCPPLLLLLLGLLGLLGGAARGAGCQTALPLEMEAYDSYDPPKGFATAQSLWGNNHRLYVAHNATSLADDVCFLALGYASSFSVQAQVVMYEADPATGLPKATPSFVQDAKAVSLYSSVLSWGEIAVTGMTALTPRVYVGFRVVSQCYHWSYLTSFERLTPRLSFWRPITLAGTPSSPAWNPHVADWDNANDSNVLLRTLGQPLATASLYNDGAACHCECGVWDPDCAKNPVSVNCSASSVCDRTGHCLAPGWNTGVCALRSYGSGDGCQCGCGGTAVDPDCFDTASTRWWPRALPCPGQRVARCSAAGACVEAWPSTCSAARYGDGVCDCECQVPGSGVRDPDCADLGANSSCGDRACLEGACRALPRSWSCSPAKWADANCDCNCGAFDPTCVLATTKGCVNSPASSVTSCQPNGVCGLPRCGNGIKEAGTTYGNEDCDGGVGCSDQCMCLPHWKVASPTSPDCRPICGDGFAIATEQCDGGLGCVNCSCTAGHTPYSPPRPGCSACGNGVLDAGELTTPLSVGCFRIAYKCGDAAVQGTEECDGGKYCSANCTCTEGHSAFSPRVPSCSGCGNGVLEAGEQCEGGSNCNTTSCRCLTDYEPTSPVTYGCIKIVPTCGNNHVQGTEECDGGQFCVADTCRCSAGHAAYVPARTYCAGCGNGVVDGSEECDGGEGCNASDCSCQTGYRQMQPAETWCHVEPSAASQANSTGNATEGGASVEYVTQEKTEVDLAPVIAVPVAMGCVVAAAAALAIAHIYRTRQRRQAPDTLSNEPHIDLPDLATQAGMADLSLGVVSSAGGRGMQSLEVPFHLRSTAPDGTPIIILPANIAPPVTALSGASLSSSSSSGSVPMHNVV